MIQPRKIGLCKSLYGASTLSHRSTRLASLVYYTTDAVRSTATKEANEATAQAREADTETVEGNVCIHWLASDMLPTTASLHSFSKHCNNQKS